MTPIYGFHVSDVNSNSSSRPFRPKDTEISKRTKLPRWELRSVVGVFRHGDRTPKQKMKMKTKDEMFLKFFEGKDVKKEVKLKTPKQMQKLLEITRKHVSNVLKKVKKTAQEGQINEPKDLE